MTDLPDDLTAALKQRFGPGWIDSIPAYKSLARSRGLSLPEVLRHAANDDLRTVVEMPVVESEPPE